MHRFFRTIAAARGKYAKRDLAMFRVMCAKGMRTSEVTQLQLDDYSQRDNTLRVRRLKGSRSGVYPMHKAEGASLRAYLRERGDAPGAMFLSRHGRGVSRRQRDRLMKFYGRIAGLPRQKCHAHVLKHTRGTQLHEAGEDILMIQHELGHREIRNTQHYTHISAGAKKAQHERNRDKW